MQMAQDQVRIHEYNEEKGVGSWPHPDGWGLAYLDEQKQWKIHRSIRPFFDDPDLKLFKDLSTTLAIIHLRRSSVGDLRLENTHPFWYQLEGKEEFIFCHNGTIKEEIIFPKSCIPHGTTDSEKLFYTLLPALYHDNPVEEMRKSLQTIANYTGINFFLSSPTFSIINIQALKAPLFYQMHLLQQEGLVVISSDPLPTVSNLSWKPLPIGNIFLLDHTTLELTAPPGLPIPPSTPSPPKSS